MIRHEKIVDRILSIIKEAQDRNYDEIVLKMDLDRYVDSLFADYQNKIDDAFEEGREFERDLHGD